MNIAEHLDLAVLSPLATVADVAKACDDANRLGIKSVCVAPTWVGTAKSWFNNVSTVIGFPHGNTTVDVKTHEAEQAIWHGAKELDVVINYGRFLSGDSHVVWWELEQIIPAAHRAEVIVKAILETCYYTPSQIYEACRLCKEFGVDMVKTSTGFGPHGATKEAVQTMLNSGLRVKASGGIKTREQAEMYLGMGCERIGSSTIEVL